ncbi:exodeoxyribonuclease V subunit gamma [Malikia granosa]|uniref:RecBCD enzyme subunit RecC n=1 Tax=Malikia granosa TaxID=263067 RepID=A0A2S9K0Y5_9BURK|nr:exodeoxyribonuclease V subunit gamma [Malikia granosa]PRD64075.1 exodeoxyribonuclease V subunit gamma [Malikia granosa]
MNAHTTPIRPGFIALHGNRLEDLVQTVIEWLRLNPLRPLEEEVVLVQSNGMAEWFKMEMARRARICAATRVELPNRFLWTTYRQVLAPEPVPRDSPLDKVPMTWRLMKVLPSLLDQAEFAPVQGYLKDEASERLLPLANKLADLFDQYQNYRADWLEDWAESRDQLLQADGRRLPVPDEQRWQPVLWRAVLQAMDERERGAIRPRLHQAALKRLRGPEEFSGRVARRVVLFGMSHLPGSTLEAMAALSRHSQVILAVPNPCRYYWGDIIEGRELLRAQRRRQANKGGKDLSSVNLEDMHQHAHPLLAAWGRQSRDYIRLLDAHDDAAATQNDFNLPRIDLFDSSEEDDATPLLRRIQNRIRDLEPLPLEREVETLTSADRSVVFHAAHGPVRELEILHDQLLQLIQTREAHSKPLALRDVVVMVPDIEPMAAAIRAVFDQYPRRDPRFIPYDIADLSAKSSSPIVTTLEWMLKLPTQRCRLSELVDLLEVPAIARRLGLSAEQLPRLTQWMSGAGIRWGLNQGHREGLGLEACGDPNSAWFGLQRMLLGYATGSLDELPDARGWDGIEPYDEIGGLEAELAGVLARLVQTLIDWLQQAAQPATPSSWATRGRDLLQALFEPLDEQERDAVSALGDALTHWLSACTQAGFQEPVAWPVFEQAWLEALNLPSLKQRFRAGGVTFCSLMPMRAIPFDVVCLLGMNDGDYPRRGMRNDFDLMGLPGQHRPGDRSRQHDDRQLMLEALLSARSLLYISWTGFSALDNSEQPPSVLVSQLRDYMAAVWGEEAVKTRTTEHPLQPFSRRYFEQGSRLQTFVHEWHTLHKEGSAEATVAAPPLPGFVPDPSAPLTLQRLGSFLRNPVKVFFRERLGVVFEDQDEEAPNDEVFTVDGLENYQLIRDQVLDWPEATRAQALTHAVPVALERLRRSGALPMAGFGDLKQHELLSTLTSMTRAWQAAGKDYPVALPRKPILFEQAVDENHHVLLRDWIDQVHQRADGAPCADGGTWLKLEPGRLLGKDTPRPDKLLDAWVRSLAAAACGHSLDGLLVGQDATLHIRAMTPEQASPVLAGLLQLWFDGMQSPLPLPLKTGIALAAELVGPNGPEQVYEGTEYDSSRAEVNEPCLARLYPSYEALAADGRLQQLAEQIYAPLLKWAKEHVRQVQRSEAQHA